MSDQFVGVIGAGSFGSAVANLLAVNANVLLYARKKEVAEQIQQSRISSGQKLNDHITVTDDLKQVASQCNIIFPVVPSNNFRDMMKQLAPHLHPYHTLIHGTKGLDLKFPDSPLKDQPLSKEHIYTMSEVIREESVVVKVGCMAGPNLASELAENQPAATVIASPFNEVIAEGKRLLRTDQFQVYGNHDLVGVELCGVLKNIVAIAAGMLSGLGYGENAKGLLISRGLIEMIYLGQALGGEVSSFIGLSGIGDLVATATSASSRNFTCGYKLAQGKSIENVLNTMDEVAEGINTIKIVKQLAESQRLKPLITDTLYHILFEGMSPAEGLSYLMKYPGNIDINFL